MKVSIAEAGRKLSDGTLTAFGLAESCLEAIASANGEGARVFPYGPSPTARDQALASDRLRQAGDTGALSGIPISVKDLFDVAGEVTRAGSQVLPDVIAARDAQAIARLREAGAVLVGRTNMTEFAYSGVGVNPHYGTPLNPFDRATGRIPGGSTSGGAVSVTDGMAIGAIGSDTGGSCRIPAALCGIAGFKPTAGRVSLEGSVPLSPTYDSIGSLANTVACCAMLDAVMAGEAAAPLPHVDLSKVRIAVAGGTVVANLSEDVSRAFQRSLTALSATGAILIDGKFPSWDRISGLGANGGIVAAEASSWHRRLLMEQADRYDPRVLSRIRLAEQQEPKDYLELLRLRNSLCALADGELEAYDAVVLPTVPLIAPRLRDLDSDEQFFAVNRLLLRNPSVANVLDLCALSIPCHRPGEPPVGLMLIGRRMSDRALLALGHAVEQLLAHP
ncbi:MULTISPECIES: amidase [Paraburkholderia]|uniref:Amidase n=1 Tax=Paraburkholderia dipogonis TaxID=1211383 RepID=A0A4Y8MGX3_9BURK|nr:MULTISPECIES: amidase [Paraburkholderia]RKR31320.1 aspartyl-tRNA(Asn)/glutamyl-tRNA(Gln) amidotransferase subunit A [Paraburkholderia sp. BL17N1]TFE36710.1 amidase [Paraburkholderia dipogonis]